MAKIVIINGSGGTGKDTFCKLCAKHMKIKNISSVQEIKEIAKVLGWGGSKTEKDRKFLSDLKLLSTEYNNRPLEMMMNEVRKYKHFDIILFFHIREPQEISKMVESLNGECTTLLIKNDRVKDIDTNMADANVYKYPYDAIIYNNGSIELLNEIAEGFVKCLIDKKEDY